MAGNEPQQKKVLGPWTERILRERENRPPEEAKRERAIHQDRPSDLVARYARPPAQRTVDRQRTLER